MIGIREKICNLSGENISMKFNDKIGLLLEQNMISEEQLEQFYQALQELLMTNISQLLLRSLVDIDIKDANTQMAILLAAENTSGLLH